MESRPATTLSNKQLANLFNLVYENYIGGPIQFNEEVFVGYCSANQISLHRSHVFYASPDSTSPVGMGLIALREDKPGHIRLGGFGRVLAAKGKGLGPQMWRIIAEAERARNTCTVELEVITTNLPAIKLYGNAGFTIIQKLCGWERQVSQSETMVLDDKLLECTVLEVDAIVKTHSFENLPWQAWLFSRSPPAKRAFRLDHAYCVVSDPEDQETDTVRILTLVVEPQRRGQGQAKRLIQALLAKFPGKIWKAIPIFPEHKNKDAANGLGFQPSALKQYQMRLKLS